MFKMKYPKISYAIVATTKIDTLQQRNYKAWN